MMLTFKLCTMSPSFLCTYVCENLIFQIHTIMSIRNACMYCTAVATSLRLHVSFSRNLGVAKCSGLQKINIFRNFCQSFWVAQSQFVSTILPQNLYFYGRLGSLRLTEKMIFSSHHKVTNYCLPPLYFASDERSISTEG